MCEQHVGERVRRSPRIPIPFAGNVKGKAAVGRFLVDIGAQLQQHFDRLRLISRGYRHAVRKREKPFQVEAKKGKGSSTGNPERGRALGLGPGTGPKEAVQVRAAITPAVSQVCYYPCT
jgi:hypothetical protein